MRRRIIGRVRSAHFPVLLNYIVSIRIIGQLVNSDGLETLGTRRLSEKGDFVGDVRAFVDVIVITTKHVSERGAQGKISRRFDTEFSVKPAGAAEAFNSSGQKGLLHVGISIDVCLGGYPGNKNICVGDWDALVIDDVHLKNESRWLIGKFWQHETGQAE